MGGNMKLTVKIISTVLLGALIALSTSCSTRTTLVTITTATTTQATVATNDPIATATTVLATAASQSATILFIIITPASPVAVAKSSNQQMTAVARYSDGTSVDITAQATWASSNTAVAVISKSGVVKGVGAGGANISASLDGMTSNPPVTVVVK